MNKVFVLSVCVIVAVSVCAAGAMARNTQGKLAQYKFVETPSEPSNPPEIGASLAQAAAVDTTVLAWYQFDTPSGHPDKQGWTEHDVTTQLKTYFHVAGIAAACDWIAPISGDKSMWCGQWPTAEVPWCAWETLPGYGNNWDQYLVSQSTSTLTYAIEWESEPNYDFTYVEWWDGSRWVRDLNANGGVGYFDGTGGPLVETLTSPVGETMVRFHFVSDITYSDEDGLWPFAEGAVKVDDLVTSFGTENWEDEACGATESADGRWHAGVTPGFGLYSALHLGATVVQEDPCLAVRSNVWGFFDDPASTNYACGGWPLQGAMPYGPDANGLYMQNEIWSPWIPITGGGSEFSLEFLVYEDLPLDNLQFFRWAVRTRDNDAGGCPRRWPEFWWSPTYGGDKRWVRVSVPVGSFISAADDEIQISIGAYDHLCGWMCGVYGSGDCHSHAPLIDQVKLLRANVVGPLWTVRHSNLWQDNFPENGGVGPADFARCDGARDTTPGAPAILPQDWLSVTVTDPYGLAADNTGGRPGSAVYVFVRVTDRFGNTFSWKNGLALQSPDNVAFPGDPNAGLLRWPFVPGLAPAGWDAYRMDRYGQVSPNSYIYTADLMDVANGQHPLEDQLANVGIFTPGDVIWYFFGARNTLDQWKYFHRTLKGQGSDAVTNNIQTAVADPMEWSVLPDAGREPGDLGDILFVDDADDRGGPAQLCFDWAFKYLGIEDRVDRFDVLGPSSYAGNSLASRVKNIQQQMIGGPVYIYQKVLWNCSDLTKGLMGDGGTPNGGSSKEKSDDFGLCYTFLTNHPDNPGWAYWGDDVVEDWATLIGTGAVNVKNAYMNHTITLPAGGNQQNLTGVVSPRVYPTSPLPPWPWLRPTESFYAWGGCPIINDFDVPNQSGNSMASHRYHNASSGPAAALSQSTPNSAASTARFFLAGFGFNFIRDDDVNGVPDYVNHLQEILLWFENVIDEPVGIDPVAFDNSLENAHPNPFNPTTTIGYSIAEPGHVSLKVYNAAGQLVRTLINEDQAPQAGGFTATWDGVDNQGQGVASGVYFYQLTAKNFSQTKKMVVLR